MFVNTGPKSSNFSTGDHCPPGNPGQPIATTCRTRYCSRRLEMLRYHRHVKAVVTPAPVCASLHRRQSLDLERKFESPDRASTTLGRAFVKIPGTCGELARDEPAGI